MVVVRVSEIPNLARSGQLDLSPLGIDLIGLKEKTAQPKQNHLSAIHQQRL